MKNLSIDPKKLKEKEYEFYEKRMGQLKRGHSGLFNEATCIHQALDKNRYELLGVENDILLDFQTKYLKKYALK